MRALSLTLLLLSASLAAQTCGDCNADGVANITDALAAAQHAVQLITIVSPDFNACNVAGDPGGPGSPGNPTLDIFDALLIAQYSAALIPSLTCTVGPVVSPGPYDVVFQTTPAQTQSSRRFEVEVILYIQGTAQPAIPVDPLQVALSADSGTGTLRGSVTQWVTTDTHTFGNLFYGPVESFTLRASAGAPHTDGISSSIANQVEVRADHRGSVQTSSPYPSVRFHFLDDEVISPVPSGTFDWQLTDAATAAVYDSGSVPLTGQSQVDVPVTAALPGNGLYRVSGEIQGTAGSDVYPLCIGSTADEHIVTLASGRVGIPYDATIMSYLNLAGGGGGYVPPTYGPYTSFLALDDTLPPGLSLAAGGTGQITGTPTRPGMYEFTVYGVNASWDVTRFPVHLAVFSWRDTEVVPGVDFSAMGPHAVSFQDFPSAAGTYTFTNSWDCTSNTTRARFYYPTSIASMPRLPAIAFIHGNGFDWDDYDEIMTVVASYGIVIGSCNNPGYPSGTCTYCGGAGSSLYGFARATGFQDSVLEKFHEIDTGTLAGSPVWANDLVGKIDFDNIFFSGHSRGGATTLMNMLWKPQLMRGAIPIMQVDPKGQSCLGLQDAFPPVPCLSFSAERDGDVIWPIAEVSMDDKTLSGMTSHVTVYGACHNQTGDTNPPEAAATITRPEQHQRVRHWFGVFIARHARGDLRLEGQLYLDEHQSSTDYAVFGQRDMNSAIIVDDHQTTGSGTNLLGGPNSSVTVTVSETNTMPGSYTYSRSLLHRRLGFGSGAGTNTWSAPVGSPVDTSACSWLAFRGRQYDSTSAGSTGTGNWQSWLATWDIVVEDGVGQQATIDMVPMFPVSGTPSPSQQRFHRFAIRLEDFVVANPALDPTSIQWVRFGLGPAGTSSRFVGVDDIRFE